MFELRMCKKLFEVPEEPARGIVGISQNDDIHIEEFFCGKSEVGLVWKKEQVFNKDASGRAGAFVVCEAWVVDGRFASREKSRCKIEGFYGARRGQDVSFCYAIDRGKARGDARGIRFWIASHGL
jgi:hypothetical protein